MRRNAASRRPVRLFWERSPIVVIMENWAGRRGLTMMREPMRSLRDAASLLSVAVLIALWMRAVRPHRRRPPIRTPIPARRRPPTGPDHVGQRAQSAVEGMLMGAIIGGQAGPIGAAVGAGTFLIYSAITGDVPLQGGRSSRPGTLRGRAAKRSSSSRSSPRSRVRTPSRPRSRRSSGGRRSCFGRSSGTKPRGPRTRRRRTRPTTRP